MFHSEQETSHCLLTRRRRAIQSKVNSVFSTATSRDVLKQKNHKEIVMSTVGRQPHSHVILNAVVVHLLRSPVHWLISRNLLLITFIGRKSGQQFTTPVTYMRDGDTLQFFSDQRWWRNLAGGAPVTLRIQGRVLHGVATPSQDVPTIVAALKVFFARKGVRRARMINVTGLDPRRPPTDAELEAIARQRVIIVVALAPAGSRM